MSFTKKILMSMILGIITGVIINIFFVESIFISFVIENILATIGDLFLILLKMIVLPLIFVSVISGMISINDTSKLGRLGTKTIGMYLLTTAIATSLAVIFASFIIFDTQKVPMENNNITFESVDNNENAFLSFFPSNFFASLAEGNVIQVLVFALILGFAASMIKKDIPNFVNFINELNGIFTKLILMIINLAPIAVACILIDTFAALGIEVLIPLIKYFVLVIVVLLAHFIITYSSLIYFFSDLKIKVFYQKIKSIIIFTFSTSSSNASIPYTLKEVTSKYGVDKSYASFSVPLGATINMDGTAIMQGCATFFLAAYYGINLDFSDILTIIFTATIASIGTAGIPSAGIIMLSLILVEIGIPTEGIALLLGVDRLLDMIRTSVNVAGDTCITCIIASSENLIDNDKYHSV